MRKLFLTALAILGLSVASASAQVVEKTKTTEKTKVVKPATKTVKKTDVVLKKDGTPDKRYKTTKKVVLKKDGTPDKRYK